MALKCNLPIYRGRGGKHREIEVNGRGTFCTFVLFVQQKINKLRKQRPSRYGSHQYSRSISRKLTAFELRSRRIQPFSWSSPPFPAPKTKSTPLLLLLSPPFWLHVNSAPKKREIRRRRRRRRIFPWMSRRGGGEKEGGGGLFTSA